jgi:putative transposase
MLLQQAFQFELRPNGDQQRAMRRTAGYRRVVFNKALALQQEHRAAGGKYITYNTLALNLKAWRDAPDTAWLKDAPFHTLQQALRDLDRAYQNFFKGLAAFPTFKKKGRGDSFRFPDPKQIEVDQQNGRIKLPKFGWMRYRNSRQIVGDIRNVTISSKCGKWFASIQTQREVAEPVPQATSAIGVDVGINRFAAFSDGAHLAPLNSFRKHEQRLKKYQRRMSRKVKFSHNWKKAKAKVTKIHHDIANARKDYLHKATTAISKNHALVAIEDLQVRNMSKSASGTVDAPGRNVRAKAGLNKAILDQGWFEFRRQLDYKLSWRGGWLVSVPAHYTSQTCPCCGTVDRASRRSQSEFLCTTCWYEDNADTVGAINVLDRALAILSSEGQDTAQACAGYDSTARIACEVNGAVRPSAAGTRRSDQSGYR